MEDYSKLVIELYREQFLAYTVGLPVNVDSIFSVQDCLLKAIDKAKVNNEPTDYLVNLKNEVDFLKYQIKFVTIVTLLTRQAIACGVPLDSAFSLSDALIQGLKNIHTVPECIRYMNMPVINFVI